MSKKVFIINGSGGVGKDTFCEYADLDYMERVRSEVETEKEVMNSVCDDWDNLMEIYSR